MYFRNSRQKRSLAFWALKRAPQDAKQIPPKLQNLLRSHFCPLVLLFAVQEILYIVEQRFRNNRLMDARHMTDRFVLIWPYVDLPTVNRVAQADPKIRSCDL